METINRVDSRFKITRFQIFLAILAVIMLFGVIAGLIVMTQGLVVTNLTDLVPWGLWITIDLSAIALSAGAFLLCAAVYILRLKEFQPIARTATYVAGVRRIISSDGRSFLRVFLRQSPFCSSLTGSK